MTRRVARRAGCFVLLRAVLVTCLLLVINRALAPVLYLAIMPTNVDWPRLRTVVQFLFIVAMLLPEWWVIDYVVRFFAQLRQQVERAAEKTDRDR